MEYIQSISAPLRRNDIEATSNLISVNLRLETFKFSELETRNILSLAYLLTGHLFAEHLAYVGSGDADMNATQFLPSECAQLRD